MPSGLSDKLYWRDVPHTMRFHCYAKVRTGCFQSLCGKYTIERSGGQASERPEAVLRCALCDGAEIDRRGWEESGPVLKPRMNGGVKS